MTFVNYDIPPGNHVPWYYYTYPGNEGWNKCLPSPYTYSFQAGKKYTVTCDDDGSYLTFYVTYDGNIKSSGLSIPLKEETTVIRIPKQENTRTEKPKAIVN